MSPAQFGQICRWVAERLVAGVSQTKIALEALGPFADVDRTDLHDTIETAVEGWRILQIREPARALKVGSDLRPRQRVLFAAEQRGGAGWTPPAGVVQRMGKESDKVLAAECRVSEGQIARARRRLEIDPYQAAAARIDWTPQMDALLGTAHDAVIAAKLGLSRDAVKDRRIKRGIAPHRARAAWTPQRLAVLRGEPDNRRAAELLGLSVKGVRTARRRFPKP